MLQNKNRNFETKQNFLICCSQPTEKNQQNGRTVPAWNWNHQGWNTPEDDLNTNCMERRNTDVNDQEVDSSFLQDIWRKQTSTHRGRQVVFGQISIRHKIPTRLCRSTQHRSHSIGWARHKQPKCGQWVLSIQLPGHSTDTMRRTVHVIREAF